MALLIDIRQPQWMTEAALRDTLAPLLPGVTIHCGLRDAPMPDVIMAAVVRLHPEVADRLPNLKLVQKLGAGVESIVSDPELSPRVRIARLAPDAPANEIAEYCLAYILRFQRNMPEHENAACQSDWTPIPPKRARATTVAVLGLGHIGARTASLVASLGFPTIGWSRLPKTLDGVSCHAGPDALDSVLAQADYVVSILPSTPETRGLFDAERLAGLKPGAVLINAGRGDLIVDEDLIAALDRGALSGAVLDVFREEPLPVAHPFWTHPRVTVTPHVSGWHLDDGLTDVAENYRRLMAGEPLLHEVERDRGY